MLKSPIRKIGGYGLFSKYTDLPASQAWHQYGLANGVYDFGELVERTQKYAQKNIERFSPSSDPVIGCVILSDPMLYDDDDFFAPEDYGFEFSKNIVKFKTYEGQGIPFTPSSMGQTSAFTLLDYAASKKRRVPMKDRVGQAGFRRIVLQAYNNRCAVTGMRVAEVLDAAHIQPYIEARSNHIQNGICLRADLHRLFDEGLISINDDFRLMVSEKLTKASKGYAKLAGNKLCLPNLNENRPSLSAIRNHREQIFLG